MKEDEIERLFAGYRDSLGTCGQASAPRRATRRTAWAFAVGGAALLAVGAGLLPTDAAGKALRRMGTALRHVRTMDMTFEAQRPSGRWVVFDRERYRDGMWRFDVEKGRGLRSVHVVRNGLLTTAYERLGYATLRSAPDGFTEGADREGDPLEYAKTMIDSGMVDTPRVARVERHGATYTLVLDRPKDRYHAEITVDVRTDLPVCAESSVDYGPEHGGVGRFRQTYRFDVPLGDDLFAPPKDKSLIDLRRARPLLAERWAKPLATVGTTHVRDACVAPDGTVWLVVSRADLDEKAEWPTSLEGYAKLPDVSPATLDDGTPPFRVEGEEVAAFGFVPLEPSAALPAKARVVFDLREAAWPQSRPPQAKGETPLSSPELPLRRTSGACPESFPVVGLDRYALELPFRTWQTRAEGLEKQGRRLAAAQAYERCADAWRDFVVYMACRPLERAAALYDGLGMAAEAARARKEATALKAARER